MKQYKAILQEIKKARANITDTAKSEKELDRLSLREALKTGTEAEKEAAVKRYKEAEQRFIEECEKNDNAKMLLQILIDNAAQAFYTENIGAICEVWNKYTSKPCGEKTYDKIRAEIKEKIGLYVSIGNSYTTAEIRIYSNYSSPTPFDDLRIYSKYDANAPIMALTPDNKIKALSPDVLYLSGIGEYVENPKAHVKAIRQAHAKAKEAEKAFEAAVSAYNRACRGKMQQASTREGVKNWILL